MEDNGNENSPSHSYVSLRLADIQERCSKLIDDGDELVGLSLEEPLSRSDGCNPYNLG